MEAVITYDSSENFFCEEEQKRNNCRNIILEKVFAHTVDYSIASF